MRVFVSEPMLKQPSPSVFFRRALPSAAGAVRDLILRSMGHWGRPAEYLREAGQLMSLSAGDLRRDEAWVALVDGALAGFYRLSRAEDRFEIEEFHLEPPMIGRCIGRRMFRHATERARAGGGRWLVWSTDSHALGFYLRMGGGITGAEPSGITDDEPLTSMRLDLRLIQR
jgi:GNAT superfamily N-acetyltransferase